MKITVKIPDTAVVFTYQCVFETNKKGRLSILQDVIDSRALDKIREEQKDESNT